MVQTVSIYNNPLLATSTSSQPSQPVWKLPKKPRKKRRPKIQINPNVGLQSDQQVNPILTDKPVNPPECFTEINAALNSTEPRTEEILLEHQNSTKYTTESAPQKAIGQKKVAAQKISAKKIVYPDLAPFTSKVSCIN